MKTTTRAGLALAGMVFTLLGAVPAWGQANLSGNVRCADGTLPEMIPVYAYSVYGSDVKVSHTDEHGDYAFLLSNGTWVVQADPSYASWWAPNVHKYAMYRAEYYNNQFFYADATPLAISPGVAYTNINFVLERYTEIAGCVRNASSEPLANIPVSATVKDGTGIGSGCLVTSTDSNGNYSVYVNTGQWRVHANPEGMGYAGQYWSNKMDIASADLITVSTLGEPAHRLCGAIHAFLLQAHRGRLL